MRIATLQEARDGSGFAPVLLNGAFSVPLSSDSAILELDGDGNPIPASSERSPWTLVLDALPPLPGQIDEPIGYALTDSCWLASGTLAPGRHSALTLARGISLRADGWRGKIHGAGGDFSHAVFRDAGLSGSDFARAELKHARFGQCRLMGVTFHSASLYGADFTGADLRDADFRKADLRGANLTRAMVRGATFSGACWDADTRWPDAFEMLRVYHHNGVIHDEGCRIPDNCIRRWGPTEEDLQRAYDIGHVLNARLQVADAATHPFPDAFRRWRDADAAPCPYGESRVDRPYQFPERRSAEDIEAGQDGPERAIWLAFRDLVRLQLAFVVIPGYSSPALRSAEEYGDADDGPNYLALPDSVHPIDAVLCPAVTDWEANQEREYEVTIERTLTITEHCRVTVKASSEDNARDMVSEDPDAYADDWDEVDRDYDSIGVTDVDEA